MKSTTEMAAKFRRLNSRKLDFDNIDVIQSARIGDQLEFHRGVYSHWAVYVGRYNGSAVQLNSRTLNPG